MRCSDAQSQDDRRGDDATAMRTQPRIETESVNVFQGYPTLVARLRSSNCSMPWAALMTSR